VPLLCAILYNLYAFLVAHFALRGIGSSANRPPIKRMAFMRITSSRSPLS